MEKAGIMQDIRILCTSLRDKEKVNLQKIAAGQGAVVLSTATSNDPPHVIVTRRVGSPKYFSALRRNPRTPIVTPEWLTESVRKGQCLPFFDFAAGAFYGLIICFSGLPVAEKKALAKEVARLGGIHSPALSRECTHLVTVSTDSDKYKFAQNNKIPCLTPAWLTESAEAGWCQEERRYPVATKSGVVNSVSALQRENSLMPGDNGANQSLLGDGTSSFSEGFGGEHSGRSMEAPAPIHRQGASRFGRDIAPIASNLSKTVLPTSAPAEPFIPFWNDLDCDDDAKLFLDWCHIWMVSCSLEENFELLKLCRIGGAKRFLDPHPTLITHIVVGANVTPTDVEEVSKYCETRRDVVVVQLEWLRRSVARQAAQPADARFALSMRDLKNTAMRGVNDSSDKGKEGSDQAQEAQAPFQRQSASLQRSANQQSAAAPLAGFLANCYFTLAAVRGTSEEEAAEKLVRSHGGRLFTSSLPSGVGTRLRRAFAICPPSLTPARASSLRSSHPDFAAVKEGDRFTLYWLECCVQAQDVLTPQRGTPCFQPLSYTLPLPGAENLSYVLKCLLQLLI